MLVLNMLVICGGEAPVVGSMCGCKERIVDGNKKDAKYIMKFFKEKV